MRSFYRDMIPANSLCFDVGANEGRKTTALLKIPAEVVAIEPHTDCFLQLSAMKNPSLRIEKTGVSDNCGTEIFYRSNMHEVSTFSKKFIETFQYQSFLNWDKGEEMPVTTLDRLIQKHGTPFFIKVDVEGLEEKVFTGLSAAVRLLEFEYTLPFRGMAVNCISRINSLGNYEFNFAAFEKPELYFGSWMRSERFIPELSNLPDNILHGNIYARKLE